MKKITQLISEAHPSLSRLMTGQGNFKKIKHVLEKIELLAKYPSDYRVIKFSQGILYLSVSSAALATQVRYSASMILQGLRNDLPDTEFNAIQCKVSASPLSIIQEPLYRKNKAKMISTKTKTRLSQLSEKIDSNELKNALKKLVR